MLVTKLKSAVMGLALLVSGASAEPPATDKFGPDRDAKKDRVDQQGDPLPEHALLRIGTTRLRHEDQTLDVAASEDGRFLASYGRDRLVRIWDAKDGRPIWAFEIRTLEPWALAFSRDSKELAAVSKSSHNAATGGAFRRWDLSTGQELPNGRDHPALDLRSVYFAYQVALACRDDGGFLAAETAVTGEFRGAKTAEADINLYSPGVPKSAKTLKGHTGRVMSVCFTRDAKTLVSIGDDGTIRFWNTGDGKEVAKLPAPSMKDQSLKGNLACIAVSPDGKSLAVSLPDGSTRLLNSAGRELRRLPASQQMNAVSFSPDGKALITGGNQIESWKVDSAEPIAVLSQARNPILALSVSPDGKTVALADDANRLRLVEIATGKVFFNGEFSCRGGIAFSPLGKILAVASGDNSIGLWDVAALRTSEKPLRSDPVARFHCKGKVSDLAFAPDGKRLATVEDAAFCRIYDVSSKQATVTVRPSSRRVYAVAFSPDGKLLATTGDQPMFRHWEPKEQTSQSVGLWDSFTGKALAISEDLGQLAHTVAFHPSGKSLAAVHLPVVAKTPLSGSDIDFNHQRLPVEDRMETIRIWNGGFARELIRFEDPVQRKIAEQAGGWVSGRSRAVAVAISPDGWLLAVPGPGGIVLFETASGLPRLRLKGHLQEITALSFTPDGKTLVSTSHDSTLLVWDVTGLRTGTKLPGNSEELCAALADVNVEKAGRAVFAMADAPAESLNWFRQRLRPVSVSQEGLQKLVADLEHPKFAIREQAMRELAALGPVAETTLEKKLQANPSLEVSTRIKKLLTGIHSTRPPPDQLRAIRSVEVLERIGSNEAVDLLRRLAAGSEGAYLTSHAGDALDRLNHRKSQ